MNALRLTSFNSGCGTLDNKNRKKKKKRMKSSNFSPFACVAAKITTRPGQVGVCNGYVLEGEELEALFNTRQDLKLPLENCPETQL